MDLKEFGRFVAGIRRERGMTQAQLADRLGVTDKAVSRWERGVGFPDIATLEPLAGVLGVGVQELLSARRLEGGEVSLLSDEDARAVAEAGAQLAEREQAQLRAATWIGAAAALLFAAILLSVSDSNLGGALLGGGSAAIAAVGLYLYASDVNNSDSRKVYGAFMAAGVFLSALLLHNFTSVSDWYIALGVQAFYAAALGLSAPRG